MAVKNVSVPLDFDNPSLGPAQAALQDEFAKACTDAQAWNRPSFIAVWVPGVLL